MAYLRKSMEDDYASLVGLGLAMWVFLIMFVLLSSVWGTPLYCPLPIPSSMLPVLAVQLCIPACTIVLPGSQLPCSLPLRYCFFILETGNNWAHFYRLQSAFSLTFRQLLQAEPRHSMLLCGCAGGPRLCLCCNDCNYL